MVATITREIVSISDKLKWWW